MEFMSCSTPKPIANPITAYANLAGSAARVVRRKTRCAIHKPCTPKRRNKLALVAGQCRVELAFRGEAMLPVHPQPESHVPLYIQLRDQLRALVHAGDLRPGDRIPASRELALVLGVHRTTVANAYAELESEGLIQGHVGRGTFIQGNGNGLKLTPPPPPMLGNNNGNGLRWELLFDDERGDEILNRLTASAPEDALSLVIARTAVE